MKRGFSNYCKILGIFFFIILSILSFTRLVMTEDPIDCDYYINEENLTSTYIINESNKVYCLNASVSGLEHTAIKFKKFEDKAGVINTTLDCRGFFLEGNNLSGTSGILLFDSNKSLLKNCNVIGFGRGISLVASSSNNLLNNTIEHSTYGISLETFSELINSLNNTLINNTLRYNDEHGIFISSGINNTLINNTLDHNGYGVLVYEGFQNLIFENIVKNNLFGGISLINSDYNTLHKNTLSLNKGMGIDLGFHYFGSESDQNNISNNLIIYNAGGGLFISWSSNNSISNNLIINNHGPGISFSNSNYNFITQNLFKKNRIDLLGSVTQNSFINNSFEDNLFSNILVNFSLNENYPYLNENLTFNFSFFYPNGTPLDENSSELKIYLRPFEVLNKNFNQNIVSGHFIINSLGSYAFIIEIQDSEDNSFKRKYSFLVNTSSLGHLKYFLRPDIEPSLGQPIGEDVASLLFEPPPTENYLTCVQWVQASPDESNLFLPVIIRDINISYWYKAQTFLNVSPSIGIQKYLSFNSLLDKNQSILSSENYTWNENHFTNLSWMLNYPEDLYRLVIKITGHYPYWYTNETHPSYVNISYLYTNTPEIKNLTNPDIEILSATSPSSNLNNATIYLEGKGVTNLTVQMLNTSILYSARFNGANCNNENCSFTQNEGEINLILVLSEGEYNISITGISETEEESGSSNPSTGTGSYYSFWILTYIISDKDFEEGFFKELRERHRVRFNFKGETHHLGVIELNETSVTINISSLPQQKILSLGDDWKVDVNDDKDYDVLINLKDISENRANLTIQLINEKVSEIIDEENGIQPEDSEDEADFIKKINLNWLWYFLVFIILVLLILFTYFLIKNIRNRKLVLGINNIPTGSETRRDLK